MSDTLSIYEDFFGIKEGENLSFSFFRRPIRTTEPIRCITIPDIYRYIVNPRFAGGQTEMLRSIKDKEEADKFLANSFDFCTFSRTFNTRSKEGLLLHSELLCVCFDEVADIPSVKERLLHDECFETELLFRSPSGDGLRWTIDIDRKGWEHKRFCNAVFNYLEANGYPKPDRTQCEVDSLCFIPYDAEVYINPKYDKVKDENIFTRRVGE